MSELFIELKEKCTCQDPEYTKDWPENTLCGCCVNGFVSVFVPIRDLGIALIRGINEENKNE